MGVFFLLLLASFLISSDHLTSSGAANVKPKLVSNEVSVLKEIAAKWGKKDWDFSVDPCSGERNWYTKPPTKESANLIECDCSFENNSTCHVTTIWLKAQNLHGSLPPEVHNFSYLKSLELGRNMLTGSIPPQWATMSLESLNLIGNRLSGPFPKALLSISTLRNLSIEGNRFSGILPSELEKLTRMETLIISSNQFTGQLPKTLANLINLTDLRVSDNNFSGRIPDFIANCTKLKRLFIQGTSFEGPIPAGISALTSLIDLRITDLKGQGSDFPQLKLLKSLKILILRRCSLRGNIPGYIGEIIGMKTLDLSFNNLTGKIPISFDNIGSVDFIFLTGNMITGAIPPWIPERNKEVDVSYNNFTWKTSSPTECPGGTVNLVESYFTPRGGLRNVDPCLKKSFPCDSSKHIYSLHINCGGDDVSINGEKFEQDQERRGSSTFYQGENWAFSSTGNFLDNEAESDIFTITNTSAIYADTGRNSQLYTTARISPLSLTYYGLCLGNGNYTVKLHFAEIVLRNDSTFYSLGKRIFDVYIQGKLVLKDFNIEDEAGGPGKPIIKPFITAVKSNTLKVQFYWAGKGTTGIPTRGVYGPLISAISVNSNFKPPGHKKKTLIAVVVGTSALVLILLVLCISWRKGWLGNKASMDKELRGLELQTGYFTLRQIKAATGNFDRANKIGEGGFGPVYKGVLSDGSIIAVKQLSSKSKQGNREFVNEIGMLSALQHPHLVKLYGCCIEGNQLLLIYEYMENNSLARALFGREEQRMNLDWPTRQKICLGIARGLVYLHEESRIKIVHRDMKATNVLLDKDLTAKICDFGLAKLNEEENTHISTRIAGTIGYMAPEYAMRGYLTDKADVYSFGIVALEIVSGRSNTNYRPREESVYLLDWAYVLHEQGNLLDLVDPSLESEYSKTEALKMLNIGLLCTNPSPTLRPGMSAVVSMLEGKVPVQAPLLMRGSMTEHMRFEASGNLSRDSQTISTSSQESQTQSVSIHGPWIDSSVSLSSKEEERNNSSTRKLPSDLYDVKSLD